MTNRGSVLVTAAAAVIAIGLGLFVGAGMISSRKSRLAREGWNETLGTYDEIMQRFPAREANVSARQLEGLCAAFGIELAPRWEKDRERPSVDAAREHDAVKREMAAWLFRQIEQPRFAREPPPESVEKFLRDHSADVDAVRQQLIHSDPPLWKRQMEKLFTAPVPNLTGHLELQKVLIADSQMRLRVGEGSLALDDLEASWRLNLALRDYPLLMTEFIAMTVARMQAGALRQVGAAPSVWSKRFVELDFRESLMTALGFEGWIWTQIDDPRVMLMQDNAMLSVVSGLTGPYVEYCVSDVSEAYRRRLEKSRELEAPCDADLAELKADLKLTIPRWNVLGNTLFSDMTGAFDRLASLDLDLELTAMLLELGQARSAGEGAWPVSLPGMEESTACPGDRWDYELAPDGSMALALSREVSWPTQKGLVLPTRFAAGP